MSSIPHMWLQNYFPNMSGISEKKAKSYHGRNIDIAITSCSNAFANH